MTPEDYRDIFELRLLGCDVVRIPMEEDSYMRWLVTKQNHRIHPGGTGCIVELTCRAPIEALDFFERGKSPKYYSVRERRP